MAEMKKEDKNPDRLVAALTVQELREIIREESRIPGDGNLLSPVELAEKLGMQLSWVYERSRLGKIPTHRVGKYPRFYLAEVLEAEARRKSNGEVS